MPSNPADLAVKALNEKFHCDNGVIALDPPVLRHLTAIKATGPGLFDFDKLTLGEIVDCLAEAGLLVTPPASSAERDKEELVERIAAELADYCLNIGPNTRDLIASGSWKRMPLSVSERRDIAELAATEALKTREEL